jgi:hypothetical protein
MPLASSRPNQTRPTIDPNVPGQRNEANAEALSNPKPHMSLRYSARLRHRYNHPETKVRPTATQTAKRVKPRQPRRPENFEAKYRTAERGPIAGS